MNSETALIGITNAEPKTTNANTKIRTESQPVLFTISFTPFIPTYAPKIDRAA